MFVDSNHFWAARDRRGVGTARLDCSSDCIALFRSIGDRRDSVSVKMVVSRRSGMWDEHRRIASIRCRLGEARPCLRCSRLLAYGRRGNGPFVCVRCIPPVRVEMSEEKAASTGRGGGPSLGCYLFVAIRGR